MGNSPARRARLRERDAVERAAYHRDCAQLTAAGASCRKCSHLGRMLVDNRPHCTLDTDHDGYQPVKLDHVCPRFALRAALQKEQTP